MIHVLETPWYNLIRAVITATEPSDARRVVGTVLVEIFRQRDGGRSKNIPDIYARYDSLIENLYVSPGYRGKGYGRALLDAAEDYVCGRGCRNVCLEWSKHDSPLTVIDWYVRRGYDDKMINNRATYALLAKDLKAEPADAKPNKEEKDGADKDA